MTAPDLLEKLDRFPRVRLTRTPTPLDHLERLGSILGMRLFMKRDDLTDLAMGGDKPRKLEYELARARAQGCDTIVTTGSSQSNHARLTSAACRKLGLEPVVVLSDDARRSTQGNLLAVRLMDAEIHWIDESQIRDHWDLEAHAENLVRELALRGRRPYYIPVSGSTPLSCLGYVRAALELNRQLEAEDIRPTAIYTPFGTGGIFTAMLIGLRAVGLHCPLVGISVNQPEAACVARFHEWMAQIGALLDYSPEPGSFEITSEFVGEGYGEVTESCLDAIALTARSEGILLDPVYSGKAMSGLVAHSRLGRWSPEDTIVFLHSGGVPALFAYQDELARHLNGGAAH